MCADSLETRKKRVAINLQNKKADKVPYVMWRSDFVVNYYDRPMSQIDDYDKMFELYKWANEDFNSDVFDVAAPILLYHGKRFDILDGGVCLLMPDHNFIQINTGKLQIMQPDEYDDLINDFTGTLINKILPRRLGILGEGSAEEKYARYKQLDEVNAARRAFTKKCETELGLLQASYGGVLMPMDYLFDYLRDFSGIVLDMRRCPEKIIAVCDIIADIIIGQYKNVKPLEYSTIGSTLHLPSYIKTKDFEKMYWPSFKKVTDSLTKAGHKARHIYEKKWDHVFDFLDEFDKNMVLGFFEKDDDFREVCRRFGDHMMIGGGVSTDLLVHGTVEENINYTKGIIDDCCGDGGVFLAADLPILYKNDARKENLKAVCDTINEYGRF